MAEEGIYADDNVSVTTARIVISATTYALRNITSVRMTRTVPSKIGPIGMTAPRPNSLEGPASAEDNAMPDLQTRLLPSF